MKSVSIIRTGTANVASVIAAFERLDVRSRIVSSPGEIESRAVVLPGVGSFAAATRQLKQNGFVSYLRTRIESGQPTLAICLGMQLFCRSSEESPGCEGLGVIESRVSRFDDKVRVPQLGWNKVAMDSACENSGTMLREGFAYFANSYRVLDPPEGWRCATTDYGGRFVSAFERGNVLACQFHPELSGEYGQDLLQSWIESAYASEVAEC